MRLSTSPGYHRTKPPCAPDPTGLDRDCQFTSFLTVSGRALFLRESICAVKQACESSLVGVVGAPKRRPQRAGRRAAPQGDGQRARLGLGVVRSAGRGRGARREGLERRNTTARDEEGAVALREHMCGTTAPPGETVRSSSGGEASAAVRGRDQGGSTDSLLTRRNILLSSTLCSRTLLYERGEDGGKMWRGAAAVEGTGDGARRAVLVRARRAGTSTKRV